MNHLQSIDSRLRYIVIGLCIALFFIITRLFYLQVLSHTYYVSRSEQNFLRIESIPSQRGSMYDCNGIVLATNRPATDLLWNGTGNRTLTEDQRHIIAQVETITQKTLSPTAHQAIMNAERHCKQASIVPDLPLEQLGTIAELYPNNPNLSIATLFKRYYPHGALASHVIGYLNRHIEQGQMGLEKICDELLRGQDGSLIKTINSAGRNIAITTQQPSRAGTDIATTLDIRLQRIAEHVYPKEYAGCILIIDPENGAIRALASRPTFDPALFLKPISHAVWSELQHKQPFLNRTTNPYPPGSIFKLITISAALEHGLLNPNQIWNCQGFVEFAGRKYWCNRKWGHGTLSTPQAFAHSCNVLFFELGKLIDIDLLADYAKRFGLGQSTDFLFTNHSGIVPNRDWKMLTKGERWWPGETLSVAIGQSFLLATPLQIARMIGAIFTGYLATPRILEEEQVTRTPLDLHPLTLEFLRRSMRLVVTRGTGRRLNDIPNMRVYAKTSTAQTSDLAKRTVSNDYLEHAWCVSYVQYKSEKPLVMLVLVEHAGSSQVSSSIAKELLLAYKHHVDTV